MKITKQGRLPEDFAWEGRCSYCGTEIDCRMVEVQKPHNVPNGYNESVTQGTHSCPLCRRDITVTKTDRTYKDDRPENWPRVITPRLRSGD